MPNKYLQTDAMFSPDRVHRYSLTRIWDNSFGYVALVCLNPSTADEKLDDHTIRRCVEFSRQWGFGGMHLYNIFALRSTDPQLLYTHSNPVGEQNNEFLRAIPDSTPIICAWGTHGNFRDRGRNCLNFHLHKLDRWCLRKTLDGCPGHPLYLPYSCVRIPI